ncbi:MAG: hypothetical protein J0I43_11580 [Microbacterium sp.]|uniref:hypothetical protein n=1 Tax=Microbacterium sp. TaxID=51671 RepID=UPI001AC6669C|nr:hypothetical protein [Microbacterium sp.]MBN9177991.1 hypothetical protein [Microbacterium sp.]
MAPTLAFDRSARYGAAIVAMLVGGYLGVATDFSSIVQSEVYAGTIASDAPLLSIAQFLLVLGSMLAAVVLLPTSGWRRLGAFTLVCVVLFLWVTFGLQHAAGNVVHPVTFWRFVLDQGAVVLLAAVGGWVIARGRHPWSWTVVILAIIPALVTPILVEHSFPSSAIALISQGIVAVVGLGAVWLAVWIDGRLARRASTAKGPDAAASDPSSSSPRDQSSSVR